MNRKNLTLISRIESELQNLDLLKEKIFRGWEKCLISSDSFYLDSVALNLHGYYSALERIFVIIARTFNGGIPNGTFWYHELRVQMETAIKKIRPAVITDDLCQKLDEYRAFRHIVRNVYSFSFSAARIEPLVSHLSELSKQLDFEIRKFLKIIEE